MALVRAKLTGVTREVSRADADALLAWRDPETGAKVWEEVTASGHPRKKRAGRPRKARASKPQEESAPAEEV
jgi:hypothetical protein